ncbi:hypothetical protein BBP40_006456 [Aspergillus hancockii]|nr:hypothetical protein BBP40_006456 [Aspergillus hancockii]
MESSFPRFKEGDVIIVIYEDIYQLHSPILKARSRDFKALLTPLGQQGIGNFGYLHLELVESASHGYGILEIQDPNEDYDESKNHKIQKPFIMWPENIRHLWANIFRIFYALSPSLDFEESKNILGHCWDLVNIADCIRATRAVFPAIESALQALGQRFYSLVAEDPINWIKLGTYMRSAPIFKEAAIHVIGNWNALEDDLDYLPSAVHELCESKQGDLLKMKKVAEIRILNHCPGTMMHRGTASEDKPISYLRDISMWMAMSFYCEWFYEAIRDDRISSAPDGGAAFYRAIHDGGNAYLNTEEQINSNAFPIGSKKSTTLDERLEFVKDGVSAFVADLLVNESHYDPEEMGELPYLTCCKVDYEELPWITWPDGDWHVDSEDERFLSDYELVTESEHDVTPDIKDENRDDGVVVDGDN